MKNRKTVIVTFLLIAALLLGVGYAALTDTLTIIGNAHIDIDAANKAFDDNLEFTDAVVVTARCTGTGTTDDVCSFTADDATFTANKLARVGEVAVFKFTITNESNLDAKITINDKKLSGALNPSNSNSDKFTVTYAYEENGAASDMQIAAQGGTMDVIVTVTVAKAIDVATSATFGIELTATTVGE